MDGKDSIRRRSSRKICRWKLALPLLICLKKTKEICAAIQSFLQESNLLFVGIDIIGEYLTEINVTSPTGIQEINKPISTFGTRYY